MSIIFKVWTVHRENDELYNGPITDVCSSVEHAGMVAQGRGVYGEDAPIRERWAIRVDSGDVYLLDSSSPIDLDGELAKKKSALRKSVISRLSTEELEALGIKDEK